MQVFVTPRAEKNFESILGYIKRTWGERTAKEFVQKADEIFKLLRNFPLIGQVEKDDIRGFQLSPQTRSFTGLESKRLSYSHFLMLDRIQKRNLVDANVSH
jgi:plasmid stabilization system protein ParE